MVGIGNLFPFEVTSFRQARMGSQNTNGAGPRLHCGPRRQKVCCSTVRPTLRAMRLAEKPSIIVKPRCCSKQSPGGDASWLPPMPEITIATTVATVPLAVLDTNVVLDLWLFHDPRVAALHAALTSGSLSVLVTAPMLAELSDVLARPFAVGWPAAPAQTLAALSQCSRLVDSPSSSGPPSPRCRDPDDQMFIDLAWYWPVQWLFSRDRAVLNLARPARTRALRIVTPWHWKAD